MINLGMMDTRRPMTAGGTSWPAGYYIDSVAGSDVGLGTNGDAPWATIGKLASAGVLANGVKVFLAYGGEWFEALDLLSYTGTAVAAYGNTALALPTLSGADLVAKSGWTLTSGRTKAYERSWTHTVNTSAVGQISVWKRLISTPTAGWTLLTYATSAANCELTADTFSVVSPVNAATVTIYLHPAGDTDPNSDLYHYRITKRDFVARLGTNSSITRVCAMMQGHNDGSLIMGIGSYASECMAQYGHKHNALGYDWRGCVFYQAEGSARITSASLAVAYAGTPTGLTALATDCYADGGANFAGDAFYGHSAGAVLWVEQKFTRCSSRRASNGFSVGNTTLHTLIDCTVDQVLTTGIASFAGNVTINNVTLMLGVPHNANTPRRLIDTPTVSGAVNITDLRGYLNRNTSGAAIYGSGLLTITSSSMQLDSVSADQTYDAGWLTNSIFTNNICVGMDLIYSWNLVAKQPGAGTDYNIYYKPAATPDYGVNSVLYASLATYKAAFPALDTNTVETDPLLVGPPVNDWTFGAATPANTGGRASGSRRHLALPDWTGLNANWDKRYLGFSSHIAPSAWSPSQEPTLLSWHDASNLNSINKDGSNLVANWGSIAGTGGGNLAQASGGLKPTWNATGINGNPAIESISAGKMLGTYVNLAACTIVIVATLDTTSVSSGCLVSFASTGVANTGAGGWVIRRQTTLEGLQGHYNATNYGNQTVTYLTPFCFSSDRDNASTMRSWINGSNLVTATLANTADFDLLALFTSITAAGATGSVNWVGKIAQVLVFSGVSDTIRQKAEGFAMHRVGLGATLDVGHPYRSAPP